MCAPILNNSHKTEVRMTITQEVWEVLQRPFRQFGREAREKAERARSLETYEEEDTNDE